MNSQVIRMKLNYAQRVQHCVDLFKLISIAMPYYINCYERYRHERKFTFKLGGVGEGVLKI